MIHNIRITNPKHNCFGHTYAAERSGQTAYFFRGVRPFDPKDPRSEALRIFWQILDDNHVEPFTIVWQTEGKRLEASKRETGTFYRVVARNRAYSYFVPG